MRIDDIKRKQTNEWLGLSPDERLRRKENWRNKDHKKVRSALEEQIAALTFWQRIKLLFL